MNSHDTVIVTHGDLPFATQLANSLVARGFPTMSVGRSFQDSADAKAEFARLSPNISAVVHVCGTDAGLREHMIVDTEPAMWDLAAESLLRHCLFTLQAAFAAFNGRPGRVVVLTPTLGMVGAPGLVPLAAAVEGVRAMSKSAARQWGNSGVSVNLVAVPLSILHPPQAHLTAHQSPPVVGDPPDIDTDVVPAVTMLLNPGIRGLSGATIVVDGGMVMVP